MVASWLITGQYTDADRKTFALHDRAIARVSRSPRLRPYKKIIMVYEGDDHLRWVINAKVGEIEAWAQQIKEDSDG